MFAAAHSVLNRKIEGKIISCNIVNRDLTNMYRNNFPKLYKAFRDMYPAEKDTDPIEFFTHDRVYPVIGVISRYSVEQYSSLVLSENGATVNLNASEVFIIVDNFGSAKMIAIPFFQITEIETMNKSEHTFIPTEFPTIKEE